MNEVNKTLFITLYGKASASKKGILLNDPKAEQIWSEGSFDIKGKSKSKWLSYNMAMRARVFDDWTTSMLNKNPDALVIHIGCGLDSRCLRVPAEYGKWIDCDLPDVIETRRKYYKETEKYTMQGMDAARREDLDSLPNAGRAIVILEGISMYLQTEQLISMLSALKEKFHSIHVLMDVYTEFGAAASKYKNPVNDVGVKKLYGIDHIEKLLRETRLKLVKEHSFTPDYLVKELKGFDRWFFRFMFTGKLYSKIYRLYELA